MNADGSTPPRRFDPVGHLRRHPGLRKTVIWCLAVTIAMGAILIALPIAVARYAEGWLRDNGAASAHIEDVDINPFTGVVRVVGLQASGGERERLHIGVAELGIRWWPLVSERIHVQWLRLADAQVDVIAAQAGAWQVGAVTIRPTEAAAAPAPAELEFSTEDAASAWGFGSDVIALTNVQLTYRDTLFDTAVDVRELLVGSQFTWDAGRSTELTVDVSIDGAPLVLKSDVVPWAEQRQFSGALTLNDLDLADYGHVLQELAGLDDARGTINVELQMNAVYDSNGTLELRISGPLEIRNASFALNAMAIANDTLRWQGEVSIKLPAPEAGSLLRVEGDLQLAGARAVLGDLELAAELATVGWNGAIEFSPARSADASADLAVRSALTGTGFKLDHARMPFPLAALETIDASNIEISGVQNATVQQLRLQGLRLLGHPDGPAQTADVLSLKLLEMNGFGFDAERGLTADSLALRGAQATLVRNEQGEFERIAAAIAAFTDAEAGDGKTLDGEPAEPVAPSDPLNIVIADLQVQADALLRFEDRAVTPATAFALGKTDFGIKNVDSTGNRPMEIHLVTGDGNMKLTTDGTVNAFAETLSSDLAIQLTALDLPQISAYVPGYNIERGRVSADSKVLIDGGTLDVQNSLLIERLKLSGKAAEGNDPLAQGMAMPIDVALNLLRDGDDRIKLQLPVSGSLADPQFGTGDIVRQAMQKALQNAAMSYVKNALQPLGTIMLVGNIAAKAARPRFVPVAMAPGDASLSATGREYLHKLGGMLVERPSLQLTICGVATPADREAFTSARLEAGRQGTPDAGPPPGDDAEPGGSAAGAEIEVPVVTDAELLELASVRTTAVINHLVDEENIVRDRLFACRETIEKSDDEGPRTEISL